MDFPLQYFLDEARNISSEHEHQPMAFLLCGKRLVAIDLREAIRNKDEMMNVLRFTAEKAGASVAVLINEAWVVLQPPGSPDPKGPIKDEPDRRECLTIVYETKTERVTYIAMIESKDGKRVVYPYEKMISGEGRMLRILPQYDLAKS